MLVKARGPVQAVSANRLSDGIAVWLAPEQLWPDSRWVDRVDEAGAFEGEAIARALEVANADMAARLVVDVYPLDVRVEDGRTIPTHVRERMKALGPSIRPDLGKQAETTSAIIL